MKENKMATMPVGKLIITMSLPAIFSMMVQALYNIVDSFFVARISEDALRAVSLAFPMQLILIAAFVGLGIGINSSISRKLGAGEYEEAVNVSEHGYLLALVLYCIVALVGIFFVDEFFSWFTNDPSVYEQGILYARIILIFSIGRIIAQAGISTLQGSGEMVKPMKAQLIGAISNMILDPILIFGWFGLPALGIKGAAIATVTAQTLSMVYVFFVLFKGDNYIKLNLKAFRLKRKIITGILLVGLPAAIMQALVAVMLTGLNKTLSDIDEVSVAVLGVYFRLQSFVLMPVFGISQGTMPIIGFNFGSKNKERIKKALRFASLLALSYMTLGLIVFQLFNAELLGVFKASDRMLAIGVVAFKRISLMYPLMAITIILSTAFQGMGKAHYSMIITFLRQIIILLPLASFLGHRYGLDSLWFSFLIAECIGFLIAFVFYNGIKRNTMEKW